MSSTKKRKLAAILFADIQGYSALMEKDEELASLLLAKFKHELNLSVKEETGRIVNFYGDGCLAVFESPLRAIRCAEKAQQAFLQQPKVPVRIGLHSGVVVLEDDNVYGDSVNQASRVESMGLAGSVLMSESIRKHIKNQSEYETTLLGSYEFKNIEEPVRVYALNNDGFTIPNPKYIRGKLKEPATTIKENVKWHWPVIIGLLFLVAFLFYRSGKFDELIELSPAIVSENLLDDEMRSKRVAVMVFENKTSSADMKEFGTMISDWITRGLMETGEANVVSAANLQNQITQAGFTTGPNPRLARSTGIDVMLQGRYYLQEDQLIIHANLVEIESGEVIHALEPIQGSKSMMLDLLDQLTQEVLGYWSVRSKKRYNKNPPKYEAFIKYRQADEVWGDSELAERIERLLTEAYQLDTTFYASLLKLTVFYGNPGPLRNFLARDSLIQMIEQNDPPFTQWEKLRFESIKASAELRYEDAARLNEQMYKMDSSDVNSNYNSGFKYINANKPQKALDVFSSVDSIYQDLIGDFSWVPIRQMEAHFKLKNYEEVIQVARDYPFPKMLNSMAALHIRSLFRLDSLSRIMPTINYYDQKGLYNFGGQPAHIGRLYSNVCIEAYLSARPQLLSRYTQLYLDWSLKNEDESDHKGNMAWVSFLEGNPRPLLSYFQNVEDSDSPYEIIYDAGVIGSCYAVLQDSVKAQMELAKLDSLNIGIGLQRYIHYAQARILTHLNRKEEAVQQLAVAHQKGLPFGHREWFDSDILLKPLFGYPPFEELIKPKG